MPPTVFEHKVIKNKTTGKHPNFISPTLIHHGRKFSTYHYVFCFRNQETSSCHACVSFGTYEEEALSSLFYLFFLKVYIYFVVSTNDITAQENFMN